MCASWAYCLNLFLFDFNIDIGFVQYPIYTHQMDKWVLPSYNESESTHETFVLPISSTLTMFVMQRKIRSRNGDQEEYRIRNNSAIRADRSHDEKRLDCGKTNPSMHVRRHP